MFHLFLNRFVDAVAQLGGPDKATPKTIMRVMGVKGLTLYHLKSHLQKFRLGKQPLKEFNDHSIKDGEGALELPRNTIASASGIIGRSMNDNVHFTDAIRMQMEVQRRLHEQLEVQRHLQLRIEAQGKYMQTILEKACQTLAGENMAASSGGSYKLANVGNQEGVPSDNIGAIKGFGSSSPLNFPSLQDLNIYGSSSGEQVELQQNNMERSVPVLLHGFMPNINNIDNNICVGRRKRRPSPYGHGSGKSPTLMIWSDDDDDLRLHELLGTAAVAVASASCRPGSQDDDDDDSSSSFKGTDHHQIQIVVPPGGTDMDPPRMSEIYDTKPIFLSGVETHKRHGS